MLGQLKEEMASSNLSMAEKIKATQIRKNYKALQPSFWGYIYEFSKAKAATAQLEAMTSSAPTTPATRRSTPSPPSPATSCASVTCQL